MNIQLICCHLIVLCIGDILAQDSCYGLPMGEYRAWSIDKGETKTEHKTLYNVDEITCKEELCSFSDDLATIKEFGWMGNILVVGAEYFNVTKECHISYGHLPSNSHTNPDVVTWVIVNFRDTSTDSVDTSTDSVEIVYPVVLAALGLLVVILIIILSIMSYRKFRASKLAIKAATTNLPEFPSRSEPSAYVKQDGRAMRTKAPPVYIKDDKTEDLKRKESSTNQPVYEEIDESQMQVKKDVVVNVGFTGRLSDCGDGYMIPIDVGKNGEIVKPNHGDNQYLEMQNPKHASGVYDNDVEKDNNNDSGIPSAEPLHTYITLLE